MYVIVYLIRVINKSVLARDNLHTSRSSWANIEIYGNASGAHPLPCWKKTAVTLIWSNVAWHEKEGKKKRRGYIFRYIYCTNPERRGTKGVDALMSNNRAHLSTPAWPAEVQKVAPPSPQTRPLRAARITLWS